MQPSYTENIQSYIHDMVKRARQPRGIPIGGEFASMSRGESGDLTIGDDNMSKTDKALQIAKIFDEEASGFLYEIPTDSFNTPYIASVDILNDKGGVIGNVDGNFYTNHVTGEVVLTEEDDNVYSLWNGAIGAYLADGGYERGDYIREETFFPGGELRSVEYRDRSGNLHRDPSDGPAVTHYSQDGRMVSQSYFVDGKQSRPANQGPSFTAYNPDGSILTTDYMEDGVYVPRPYSPRAVYKDIDTVISAYYTELRNTGASVEESDRLANEAIDNHSCSEVEEFLAPEPSITIEPDTKGIISHDSILRMEKWVERREDVGVRQPDEPKASDLGEGYWYNGNVFESHDFDNIVGLNDDGEPASEVIVYTIGEREFSQIFD